MYTKIAVAAALVSVASAQGAYTPPGANTFGSLYTPDGSHPVTRGESFQVTWNPSNHTSGTVSLVLCHGNSNNCVNEPTSVASGIPVTAASYQWAVPCRLTPGTASTATGYGMLIIVDGTGEFQYSTQFSVLEGTKCGASGTNSSSSSTTARPSSSTSSYISTSSGWESWSSTSVPSNKTHTTYTTPKPSAPTTVQVSTTAPVVLTTAATGATATPSQFKGAATQIGGSAAALVMAAGAAFFAL